MSNNANITYLVSALMLVTSTKLFAAVTTIDFDHDTTGNPIAAPSLFANASPLTNLYAADGVSFTALARSTETALLPKDGIEVQQPYNVISVSNSGMGRILNESANFGHSAKSGDNFLAFNSQSGASANFWRINFADPIGYFGISYSAGSTSNDQYLNFQAYDVGGEPDWWQLQQLLG